MAPNLTVIESHIQRISGPDKIPTSDPFWESNLFSDLGVSPLTKVPEEALLSFLRNSASNLAYNNLKTGNFPIFLLFVNEKMKLVWVKGTKKDRKHMTRLINLMILARGLVQVLVEETMNNRAVPSVFDNEILLDLSYINRHFEISVENSKDNIQTLAILLETLVEHTVSAFNTDKIENYLLLNEVVNFMVLACSFKLFFPQSLDNKMSLVIVNDIVPDFFLSLPTKQAFIFLLMLLKNILMRQKISNYSYWFSSDRNKALKRHEKAARKLSRKKGAELTKEIQKLKKDLRKFWNSPQHDAEEGDLGVYMPESPLSRASLSLLLILFEFRVSETIETTRSVVRSSSNAYLKVKRENSLEMLVKKVSSSSTHSDSESMDEDTSSDSETEVSGADDDSETESGSEFKKVKTDTEMSMDSSESEDDESESGSEKTMDKNVYVDIFSELSDTGSSTGRVIITNEKFSYSQVYKFLTHFYDPNKDIAADFDLESDLNVMFLYKLVTINRDFLQTFSEAKILRRLVVDLLQSIYFRNEAQVQQGLNNSEEERLHSSSDRILYMALVILEKLSESYYFCTSCFRWDVNESEVYTWFKFNKKQVDKLTVGNLIILILSKVIKVNLGTYGCRLKTRVCLATLTNLSGMFWKVSEASSRKIAGLIGIVSETLSKLVTVEYDRDDFATYLNKWSRKKKKFEYHPRPWVPSFDETFSRNWADIESINPAPSLMKRPERLVNRQVTNIFFEKKNVRPKDVEYYVSCMRSLLEIINSGIVNNTRRNPDLLYEMLFIEEYFLPFRLHPRLWVYISNIIKLLHNIKNLVDDYKRKLLRDKDAAKAKNGDTIILGVEDTDKNIKSYYGSQELKNLIKNVMEEAEVGKKPFEETKRSQYKFEVWETVERKNGLSFFYPTIWIKILQGCGLHIDAPLLDSFTL